MDVFPLPSLTYLHKLTSLHTELLQFCTTSTMRNIVKSLSAESTSTVHSSSHRRQISQKRQIIPILLGFLYLFQIQKIPIFFTLLMWPCTHHYFAFQTHVKIPTSLLTDYSDDVRMLRGCSTSYWRGTVATEATQTYHEIRLQSIS